MLHFQVLFEHETIRKMHMLGRQADCILRHIAKANGTSSLCSKIFRALLLSYEPITNMRSFHLPPSLLCFLHKCRRGSKFAHQPYVSTQQKQNDNPSNPFIKCTIHVSMSQMIKNNTGLLSSVNPSYSFSNVSSCINGLLYTLFSMIKPY